MSDWARCVRSVHLQDVPALPGCFRIPGLQGALRALHYFSDLFDEILAAGDGIATCHQ